jgi:hypothetical protein
MAATAAASLAHVPDTVCDAPLDIAPVSVNVSDPLILSRSVAGEIVSPVILVSDGPFGLPLLSPPHPAKERAPTRHITKVRMSTSTRRRTSECGAIEQCENTIHESSRSALTRRQFADMNRAEMGERLIADSLTLQYRN